MRSGDPVINLIRLGLATMIKEKLFMALVIYGKKNFIQWRTIVVSIEITVMVSCSGGGRLDLILNTARKNVNFKPRDMVVAMMGGEWSMDVKSNKKKHQVKRRRFWLN